MTANRNFVRFTHSKIIIAIYVQVFVKIFVKMWPSQSDPSAHRYRDTEGSQIPRAVAA